MKNLTLAAKKDYRLSASEIWCLCNRSAALRKNTRTVWNKQDTNAHFFCNKLPIWSVPLGVSILQTLSWFNHYCFFPGKPGNISSMKWKLRISKRQYSTLHQKKLQVPLFSFGGGGGEVWQSDWCKLLLELPYDSHGRKARMIKTDTQRKQQEAGTELFIYS